jgi:hypothetical protein
VTFDNATVTSVSSSDAACDATSANNFTVAVPSGFNVAVAAGGTASGSLNVTMPTTVANACQGDTFTVNLHLTGHSS